MNRIAKYAGIVLLLIGATPLTAAAADQYSQTLPIVETELIVKRFTQSIDTITKFDAIHDITFDAKGYIWLATEIGIQRFDGTRLITWGAAEGISNEYSQDLEMGHQGDIWVATNQGLNRFDPVHLAFTHYLKDDYISEVIESKNHLIYAATLNGLVALNPDGTLHNRWTAEQHALPSNTLRTVFEDSQGNIWVGYGDAGISRFNPSDATFTHFQPSPNTPGGLPSNEVREFAEDAHGQMWVGTWGQGLCRLNSDNKTFTRYPLGTPKNSYNADIITDIMLDSKGVLWVSADKGGVFRFDEPNNRFLHHQHDALNNRTLLSNTVRRIAEDPFNNIWFLTFPGGLNQHIPFSSQFKNWRHHALNKNSLSDSSILSLLESKDGNIWIGTEKGLNKINSKTNEITHFNYADIPDRTIPALAVTALAEDGDHNIWIGTWSGGLAKLNPKTGKMISFTTKQQFYGKNIWALFVDKDNTVWVGSENEGLLKYNKKTHSFTQYIHDPSNVKSLSSNYVAVIQQDKHGKLWVGTQQGINQFDINTGEFTHFNTIDSVDLHAQRIKSMILDDDTIWMGTQNHGLLKWNTKTQALISIDQSNGLPSNTVSTLALDANKAIWAGTLAGLAKINAKKNTVDFVVTHSDGIAGSVLNRDAIIQTDDDTLLFGTTEGLTQFNPRLLSPPKSEPSIELSQLDILGQNIDIKSPEAPLKKDIAYSQNLVLGEHENLIEIGFANLNFTYGNKTHFAYKLEHYDNNWREVIGNSDASFANLPPGKYQLVVKAKNRQGQWSPNIRTLNIEIKPPFWKSSFALALYFTALIVLISLVARLLFLRLLNNKLHLEVQTKTEALRQANAAKTVFLANISHELRTPLNAITGFSARLIKRYENQLDERAMNSLQSINRNGIHLSHLINDLLDLSKIESGKMEINIAPCDVITLILNCAQDLQGAANAKGLALNLPTNTDYGMIMADNQRLTQIVHNLLSNAIKYSEHGEVSILVETQLIDNKTYCAISIKDTGKGIRKEDLDKLFTRFEQVDQDTKYIHGYGTGLGLALVDEFTSLHGGTVRCESELGKGSTFTVYLPKPEQTND